MACVSLDEASLLTIFKYIRLDKKEEKVRYRNVTNCVYLTFFNGSGKSYVSIAKTISERLIGIVSILFR